MCYQSNISALCWGPPSALGCLCHSFHRKMERQEIASCCETYKAGYSCIGFCSCFRASGLLCGDTAACTLVAEEPDHKSNHGQKGNQRFKQLKTKNVLNYIIYRNMKQFKSLSVIQKAYFFSTFWVLITT